MTSGAEHKRPLIASPEDDPNASITCSSPPCFMHELDPSWLGYLRAEEVSTLLGDLLAAEWSGTVLETAWLCAMLRRHLARLGGASESAMGNRGEVIIRDPGAERERDRQELLASRLRCALPRIHDDALRRDLRDLLGIMDRDLRRCHARHAE